MREIGRKGKGRRERERGRERGREGRKEVKRGREEVLHVYLPHRGTLVHRQCSYMYLLCHLCLCSAEDNLAKIEATYGSGSCLLLHINSRRPDSVVLGDNPWSRVVSHYTAGNSTHQVGH